MQLFVCPEGCLCVFGGLFRRERLKIKLGVETNGGLGKASDGRKVVGSSRETHAVVHAVDAKPLELISQGSSNILGYRGCEIIEVVKEEHCPANLCGKEETLPSFPKRVSEKSAART